MAYELRSLLVSWYCHTRDASALLRWARKRGITLARAYYGDGGKVQLRTWSKAHQLALWVCGWIAYARRVGNRYQLTFAPRLAGDATPSDLYAV